MVAVSKLSVQNIRSHKSLTTELSPQVTVITGKNGSGKTSLIEAIYIALQGSSFKGSDNDLLRVDSPWWRIELELDDGSKRSVTFDPEKKEKRKTFIVDNKTTYRLPLRQRFPVVLFEPDDLRLVHGSPARRRQFIDKYICQINPDYSSILRKYERSLVQRNNLLKKHHVSSDDLFVWDIAISEYGTEIINQRTAICEQIDSKLTDAYRKIATTKDNISIHYSGVMAGDIKQKLIKELSLAVERDKYLGNTSVGPHRHDVIFKLNGLSALSTASRGETRTIIVALKLLESEMIHDATNIRPLIMLDDVFSELDDLRQKALVEGGVNHQTIITSAQLVDGIKSTILLV